LAPFCFHSYNPIHAGYGKWTHKGITQSAKTVKSEKRTKLKTMPSTSEETLKWQLQNEDMTTGMANWVMFCDCRGQGVT
jgi:hypothetical protein